MSKSGGKTNAAAWQPTNQAASKSIFTSRPFPEIVQQEQETAGNGEKAAQQVNRRGSLLENINRSMAKNSIPAELNAPNVGVQAKLTIGEPGDQYEQEADRVAAVVVQRMNEPAAPRITAPPRMDGFDLTMQRKPVIPIVASRLSPGVEVPLMRQNGLTASRGPNVQADFESKLNQARGGGGALDAAFRAKIEPAMGADFSRVRVHTDSGADEMSQSIQAKAFTTGQDVFFRQGAYEPGSRGGQELIAHELTHVVQQNGGTVMRSPQPLVNLIQKYDVLQFDSWTQHYQWLLREQVKLPSGINLKVDYISSLVEGATAGVKAMYLAPGHEGMTAEGDEWINSSTRGGILVDEGYVEDLARLPREERVATLLSTIRHELQHAENLKEGHVKQEDSRENLEMDEVIAHSENILNRQLDGKKSDAPLWDMIEHLKLAEEYYENGEGANPEITMRAEQVMAEAKNKLGELLSEYGNADRIIDEYLNEVDFSNVTKSEAIKKVIKKEMSGTDESRDESESEELSDESDF